MAKGRQVDSAGITLCRRAFNKLALGVGASLSFGGLLSACEDESSRSNDSSERKTLHFTLDHLSDDAEHILNVGGRKYILSRHTEDTLTTAQAENPLLAQLPSGAPTHYATDVALNTRKPHLMSLTTHHPERGPGLVYTAMHLPFAELAQARAGLLANPHPMLARSTPMAAQDVCTMHDEIADDFVTGFKAAQSILWHHPDIATTDAEAAARISVLMENCADVLNLAMSICRQGPAYQHDDRYEDGWCVLVPLYEFNPDDPDDKSTPKLDSNGEQMFDYVFSDITNQDMKPAIKSMLELIKNDPVLKGLHYRVRYTGDSPEDPQDMVEARGRSLSAGGAAVSCSFTGYHHNVAFTGVEFYPSDQSIQLSVWNENFIWYGVYAEYLDADGEPLNWKDLGLDSNLGPELNWVETDTCHYQDIVAAPPTVFGVPIIPFPTLFKIKLPEGASGIRVSLRGPGAHGSVDHWQTLSMGLALTALIQFGVPTYFLCTAKGIDETQSLSALFSSKAVRLQVANVLFRNVTLFSNPDSMKGMAVAGSFAGLLESVLDTIITLLISKEMPALTKWIVEKFSTEEAEFSAPFAGWIARIICNCGTVGDIIAMFAEIGTNPMVIENKIMVTSSVEFTINYDPDDYQFPEEATSYDIIIQFEHGDALTTNFPLTQDDRSQHTLSATVDHVPVTGKTEKFEVRFLSPKGWEAALGKGSFLNKSTSSFEPIVAPAVTIEEYPMPVDGSTIYEQHRKLAYSTTHDNYYWDENNPALPEIEVHGQCLDYCGPDNITVWVPGGMLGYSWKADMDDDPGHTDCHGTGGGQLHYFKNVNLREADANTGLFFSGCGFQAPAPLAYETLSHDLTGGGLNFYLDPVSTSLDSPDYHLRRLTLDNSGHVAASSHSWGRFRIQLDRLAVIPTGYVAGISTNSAKLAILKLPEHAVADADLMNNAVIVSGQGQESDAALHTPVALTISSHGAILVLENDTGRIKAFDVDGKPWKYFKNKTTSVLDISEPGLVVSYLDVSMDPSDLIFVLSRIGDVTTRSNYRLDVYGLDGTRIMRNPGVSVARMVVDKFRRLYSLNYETIQGSPIVEPSVSVWMPDV